MTVTIFGATIPGDTGSAVDPTLSLLPLARRLVAVLVLLAPIAAARAVDSAPTPKADVAPASPLRSALEREVQSALRSSKSLGVHVVDLADRREIYGWQADAPRILASNTKLLTTAAALAELGPDFVFETKVMTRGETRDGALAGDLAIVGAGDPNLSGRFHEGDPYAVFRPWARALAERGVRVVEGDLVLVNGLFEAPRVHPDWPRDQLTTWYEAPVDALSYSDNCILVRVRPAHAAGAPASVETVPPLDYFKIRNTTRTGGRGSRLYVTREDGADVLVVSGTVSRGSGPLDVWVAVHDPTAYFAAALRGALAEHEIEVRGTTRPVHGLPEGVWEEIAAHRSDLATTLAVTNKRSQNFYAECLAKLLGRRIAGSGSWDAAAGVVSHFLAGLGLDPAEYRVADGSGLSRANQASPRAMTRVLEGMYFHDFGRDFVRSLPHSGEPGLSWQRRLAQPPYRDNVLAKTGSLNGVSTLSGYAKGVSGRVYAFSILCNQIRSASDARAAQDRIVRALVDRG